MAISIYTLPDKTVTTAGTRVQLTGVSLYAFNVIVQALNANTGKIYIGDSSVSSTQAVAELNAGCSCAIGGYILPGKGTMELIDISTLYIDSSVSGDKVHIGYELKST